MTVVTSVSTPVLALLLLVQRYAAFPVARRSSLW